MATKEKRASSLKRQARVAEKESATSVKETMQTENIEEIIPISKPPTDKEEISLSSIMQFMKESQQKFQESQDKLEKKYDDSQQEMRKKLDDSQKTQQEMKKNQEKLEKQFEENREELNWKLDRNQEDLYQKIEDNKIELQMNLQAQFETYKEEICQQLNTNNENWKSTQMDIQTVRDEVKAHIEDLEEETTHKIESIRQENKEEREYTNARITTINKDIGQMNGLIDINKDNIEEIRKHELVLVKEELERIRNRPVHIATGIMAEHKETINFKNHKRNPMEFLARLNEHLQKQGENRWENIRSLLDEHFREITDNWWTATRQDLNSYEEFKGNFKAKYWSESTQNIVRDNLCNGRYNPNRGQTPTAYFLGKICLARNLEPKIPEECLVTKLAYHYDEGISRARLYGQIKTIQAMETLLENYEHESYYRRTRQQREYPMQDSNTNIHSNGNAPHNGRNNYSQDPRNNNNRDRNYNRAPRFNNNNNNNNNGPSQQNNNNQRSGNYQDNRNYRPRINFVQGRRTNGVRRNSWNHNDRERYDDDRRRNTDRIRVRSHSNEDRRRDTGDERPFIRREIMSDHEDREILPAVIHQTGPLNDQRQ